MTSEAIMNNQRIDDVGPPFEPATPEEFLARGEAAFQQWWDELDPADICDQIKLDYTTARCLGILKGVYDFQWYSKTEFKDWAVDAPGEYFWIYLEEWKKYFQQRSSASRMIDFLREHCLKWAERALRTVGSRK